MSINFQDISYLQQGSRQQQAAYKVLKGNDIMGKLQKFQPILAGTIPLNIDIDGSDLDIICCFDDPGEFAGFLTMSFGRMEEFTLKSFVVRGERSVTGSFAAGGFIIEIFGQAIPTTQQMAYRHMIIESRLLEEHGEVFRSAIVQLKKSGMKTEPAFAAALGLAGDPYLALLELKQ